MALFLDFVNVLNEWLGTKTEIHVGSLFGSHGAQDVTYRTIVCLNFVLIRPGATNLETQRHMDVLTGRHYLPSPLSSAQRKYRCVMLNSKSLFSKTHCKVQFSTLGSSILQI